MFAEAYARMCKEIGTIVVANDASMKGSMSFKSRLVNKCQDNFERRQGPNKEPFDDLKTQCEQTRQEVRRRYVGTVRIIGELYKTDQLTNSIMKSCIMQLLETESKDCSEEDLECVCVLLTTIGRKMEVDNGQNLGPYFEKLHDIFHNKEKHRLSRKIRFAIQDVMELRQIGWTTKQHSQDQRAAEPARDYRGTVQRGSGRWINSGGRVYGRDNRAQSWRSGNRNPSVNLEQLLLNNIERDEVSRKTVAHYVAQMFKEKAIARVDYLQALKTVFEQADDLIIDIPELFKYLSIFYVRLLNMFYINLRDIRYVARSVLPKYGAAILSELLLKYQAVYGRGDTVKLWYESALKWTDFINMDNPEQYLMDSELGYLVDIVKFEQQFQSYLISAEKGMNDLHLN
ncbi:hypothetical protein RP20_CCG010778 [Aedes albopictus]|nr:eukaryotic translation initiation factor 4 gamma 3-like [Aedes albopictus]KXJ75881.1 hypothetical protein RP20_CCG010778 [Aedes albopictus]